MGLFWALLLTEESARRVQSYRANDCCSEESPVVAADDTVTLTEQRMTLSMNSKGACLGENERKNLEGRNRTCDRQRLQMFGRREKYVHREGGIAQ